MIILFAFFVPTKPHATQQTPDYLIYNGKTHPLEVIILNPYLVKAKKWEWIEEGQWCTALVRGYYATVEIVNNELVLKDINDCFYNSLLKKFLSTYEVKDSIFKLDWFTDSLVIGEGKLLYNGIHEYYSKLHFKKGVLIKKKRMDYKEYLTVSYLRILFSFQEEKDDTRLFLQKRFLRVYQIDSEVMEHYLEIRKEAQSGFLTKLKTQYEKKFGQPISDFELKIQKIYFAGKFEITRTLYGARLMDYKDLTEVKLNTEEWLDFIRALYTCCLDKWKYQGKDYYDISGERELYVYFSSEEKPYDDYYVFPTKDAELPNLNEFEKIMEDMIARNKRDTTMPQNNYNETLLSKEPCEK
jgi:hypothetical protein